MVKRAGSLRAVPEKKPSMMGNHQMKKQGWRKMKTWKEKEKGGWCRGG
jgi:hypothetical protein